MKKHLRDEFPPLDSGVAQYGLSFRSIDCMSKHGPCTDGINDDYLQYDEKQKKYALSQAQTKMFTGRRCFVKSAESIWKPGKSILFLSTTEHGTSVGQKKAVKNTMMRNLIAVFSDIRVSLRQKKDLRV